MKLKEAVNIIFTITLFLGLVFALLPHALHEQIGLIDEDHLTHMLEGLATVILSLIILVYNNNAFRKPPFLKKIKGKK